MLSPVNAILCFITIKFSDYKYQLSIWPQAMFHYQKMVQVWPDQIDDYCPYIRFAIDSMQSICLDEAGGEKFVDPRSQETTLIHHIFGGHLQSQVK